MKLRAGLIGLGDFWHHRHAPALRMLSDRYELRAVCDQVGHRAQQVAMEFGATAVDGFRALSRREDVDVVLILAHQWFGALPVLAACEAGKAVYCASGMELGVDDAIADQRLRRIGRHRLHGRISLAATPPLRCD